jgi:hypothetical protein
MRVVAGSITGSLVPSYLRYFRGCVTSPHSAEIPPLNEIAGRPLDVLTEWKNQLGAAWEKI